MQPCLENVDVYNKETCMSEVFRSETHAQSCRGGISKLYETKTLIQLIFYETLFSVDFK